MHINTVVLVGTVCADPEMRYVGANQQPTCSLRVACNRTWKSSGGEKKKETLFIDVDLWAKTAEIAVQYLTKGRLVGVQGYLKLDEWTDQEGNKRQKTKIVGNNITLFPSFVKREDDAEETEAVNTTHSTKPAQSKATAKPTKAAPQDEPPDMEDTPF